MGQIVSVILAASFFCQANMVKFVQLIPVRQVARGWGQGPPVGWVAQNSPVRAPAKEGSDDFFLVFFC